MEAIRICIGTERRTTIACKVLQHSILANHNGQRDIEFHTLDGDDWADYGPLAQYTGFSFLRWTIAEKFSYQGKAIYLDADQLVLTDIEQLWNQDQAQPHPEGSCVWSTYLRTRHHHDTLPIKVKRYFAETSVMLIDCEKAKNQLLSLEQIEALMKDSGDDPKRRVYRRIMHLKYLKPKPIRIDPMWNVMDGRGSGDMLSDSAKLLHFTKVPTQPWYDPSNPASSIWERYLEQALAAGFVSTAEVLTACDNYNNDHARPDGMHPYWRKFAE